MKTSRTVNSKTKIIVIASNSSQMLVVRKWSIENYIKLTKKILKEKNNLVVLIGSAEDSKDAANT